MVEPIVDDLPSLLGPWARRFDDVQFWLIQRSIGMRHQEHKRFWELQAARYPSERGPAPASWARDRPVYPRESVGVLGWRRPHMAILDVHGLNDRVVARAPIRKIDGRRQLAHERWPPKGYLQCFRPNVRERLRVEESGDPVARLEITKRERPLTSEEIRSCESRFLAQVSKR